MLHLIHHNFFFQFHVYYMNFGFIVSSNKKEKWTRKYQRFLPWIFSIYFRLLLLLALMPTH